LSIKPPTVKTQPIVSLIKIDASIKHFRRFSQKSHKRLPDHHLARNSSRHLYHPRIGLNLLHYRLADCQDRDE
jgi:hypothetical protein